MKTIAIIAAMPGELQPLIKLDPAWTATTAPNGLKLWRLQRADVELVAVAGGMGTAAAIRALATIESAVCQLDAIISLGWAGATSSRCQLGKAYCAYGIINQQTGERYLCSNGEVGLWVVTSPKVADEPEKLRLAASYNASLVEMEACALARLAEIRELPFTAVKGVSDGLGSKLPDFNRFAAPDGSLRMVAFVAHVLVRPWYWSGLIRMGRASSTAAHAMAQIVLDICCEKE